MIYVNYGFAPAQYDQALTDAEALQKAMKGLGTDDKVVSNIIATRTREQLVTISDVFQKKFSKSLASWLKGDLSGHYQDLCLGLILPPPEFDAHLVRDAVKGLGTDDHELIETLCTRSNQELRDMKEAYQRLFGKDLEKDVVGDTSGDYRDLLVAVLRAQRSESPVVDLEAAKLDARELFNAGEGRLGTNEKVFIDIISHRPFPHLFVMAEHYANMTGHALERGIAKETSFNFKRALLVLVTPREEYFADQIYKSIIGAGTDDKRLIRMVVHITKSKALTQAVNNLYTHKYKHTLVNDIGGDTSGWYKKTMQQLVATRVAI